MSNLPVVYVLPRSLALPTAYAVEDAISEAPEPVTTLSPEQQARIAEIDSHDADGRDADGVDYDWSFQTPFLRYDLTTGAILSSGNTTLGGLRAHRENQPEYGFLARGGDPETQYVAVKTKRIRTRSDNPARLNGRTLSHLPVPCQIEISDPAGGPQVYDVTDTSLELEFDQPGTYTVRVLAVKHLPAVFEVTVDA